MAARRLEVGRIALGVLMEVQRVFSGRQIPHVELDFYSLARRLDGGGADAVALGVLEFDSLLLDGLVGLGECGRS